MKRIAKSIILSWLLVLIIAGTAAAGPEIYTVQEGDSLWQIAHHNGLTVEYLMAINGLSDDKLYIGQELLLGKEEETASVQSIASQTDPTPATAQTSYIVQPGDSLWGIALRHGTTLERLMEMNQLETQVVNPGTVLVVPIPPNPSRSGASAEAARLLELAAKHLGTPYRYGGQSPGGFDCSGFAKYVFDQIGIQLPRTAAAQAQVGVEVPRDQLMPGDLVYFRCGGGQIDHVGIYAGNNQFIHSSSPRNGGVIYSSLSEGYYARYYSGARRILSY